MCVITQRLLLGVLRVLNSRHRFLSLITELGGLDLLLLSGGCKDGCIGEELVAPGAVGRYGRLPLEEVVEEGEGIGGVLVV